MKCSQRLLKAGGREVSNFTTKTGKPICHHQPESCHPSADLTFKPNMCAEHISTDIQYLSCLILASQKKCHLKVVNEGHPTLLHLTLYLEAT